MPVFCATYGFTRPKEKQFSPWERMCVGSLGFRSERTQSEIFHSGVSDFSLAHRLIRTYILRIGGWVVTSFLHAKVEKTLVAVCSCQEHVEGESGVDLANAHPNRFVARSIVRRVQ